jgi:hypothetical protein
MELLTERSESSVVTPRRVSWKGRLAKGANITMGSRK